MGQLGIHRKRKTDNVGLPFLRCFVPLSFSPPSFWELALPTSQAQPAIQKEPQVLLRVLTWDPCLNRGQVVCISKQSCSRPHPGLSQLQSLLQWLYKLSELCEIFSWEASSSGWHQPSACFYSTLGLKSLGWLFLVVTWLHLEWAIIQKWRIHLWSWSQSWKTQASDPDLDIGWHMLLIQILKHSGHENLRPRQGSTCI